MGLEWAWTGPTPTCAAVNTWAKERRRGSGLGCLDEGDGGAFQGGQAPTPPRTIFTPRMADTTDCEGIGGGGWWAWMWGAEVPSRRA